MKIFMQLHSDNAREILIAIESIAMIRPNDYGCTINIIGGTIINISESFETMINYLADQIQIVEAIEIPNQTTLDAMEEA